MKSIQCMLLFFFSLTFLTQVSSGSDTRATQISPAPVSGADLYENSHALVIGVSDYSGGWPDLPGVQQDIPAVEAALKKHGFHVRVVKDPTSEKLAREYTKFINEHGQEPENRLVFYFAGHGYTLTLAYGGEMGYIVPANTPNPHRDKTGFLASALDMQQIEVYAKRIQSKHVLFLFDSCFSGSIFSLSRAVPETINYKTALPVRQFITSGGANEQVADQSVFRRQFVDALNGAADANGDGYVTGAELGEFLQDRVVNYSKGTQHPQYGKIRDPNLDKGDVVFVLPGAIYVDGVALGRDAERPADPEAEMWNLVKNSNQVTDLEKFIAAFPRGRYLAVAQLKLEQLQREQIQPETRVVGKATFYDDFDNSVYDGAFNAGLWKAFNHDNGVIQQHNGKLVISRTKRSDDDLGLTARNYDDFVIDRPLLFEARLMAQKSESTYVMMTLQSDLSTEDYSDCFIESEEEEATVICSHNSGGKDKYDSNYMTVDHGTWHRVGIAVDPATMQFSYYIDGEEMGSYIPENAARLRKAEFAFYISLWGETKEKITGYFDEIRVE